MQREHPRRKATPLSDYSPVGRSPGHRRTIREAERVHRVPARAVFHPRARARVVRDQDRKPVFELHLRDDIRIIHDYAALGQAELTPGEYLAFVFQDGVMQKALRPGDEWLLVDTGSETQRRKRPTRLLLRLYSPARPWMLGLVLKCILGREPSGTGCPLCGNEQAELVENTLRCPVCTEDVYYSADLILHDHAGIPDDVLYGFLSVLEDEWLRSQIPEHKEATVA